MDLKEIEKKVRHALGGNFPGTNFKIHVVVTECIIHWENGPTENEVQEIVKGIAGDFNISCHRSGG